MISLFEQLYECIEAPASLCSNLVIVNRTRSNSYRKCLLVDRDGTLIEYSPYLIDFLQVRLVSEIVEVIKFANEIQIPVYIVSNQAGVAHGYFTELELLSLNSQILRLMYQDYGAYVDGVFCCTSHPKPNNGGIGKLCKCRKPEPGLLNAAINQSEAQPLMAGLLGDTDSDVTAALNAGLKYTWLVTPTNRCQVKNSVMDWLSGGPEN